MSANPSTKPAAARRALVAVAVPTTMAALLCTATLAGTAFASGSSSSATPPCSTAGTPTGKPTTGRPTTAVPTLGGTVRPTGAPTTAPVPTATATSEKASSTTPATAPATPTASPTTSGPGDGFWGWLNGVWQWIFSSTEQVGGTDNVPQAAAAGSLRSAPIADAGSNHTTPATSGTVKTDPLKTGTTPLCVPTTGAPLHRDAAAPAQQMGALIPWHLSTPSMTMYGLTFNGVDTIGTVNGSEQVLDFTVDKVEIQSMVTYSYPGGKSGPRQYNNAGSGTTTVLTDVHLWTTTMTASVYGLIQVTLTPTSPITTILGVAQGFKIPIPVVFTGVNADNALLSSGGLNVPGFAGFSGG